MVGVELLLPVWGSPIGQAPGEGRQGGIANQSWSLLQAMANRLILPSRNGVALSGRRLDRMHLAIQVPTSRTIQVASAMPVSKPFEVREVFDLALFPTPTRRFTVPEMGFDGISCVDRAAAGPSQASGHSPGTTVCRDVYPESHDTG